MPSLRTSRVLQYAYEIPFICFTTLIGSTYMTQVRNFRYSPSYGTHTYASAYLQRENKTRSRLVRFPEPYGSALSYAASSSLRFHVGILAQTAF